MHLGERVTPRHGLSSSHPSGLIVKRGTPGVVAGIDKSSWGVMLYNVVFEVPGEPDRLITVEGVGERDIIPVLYERHRLPARSPMSKAS